MKMKKTNLMKVVSILLISAMVILFNASVFAADNTGFNDLTSTLTNSSNNSNNANSSNTTNSNTNTSNTNINTSNNSNKSNTNSNVNSNMTSIYNTNLPKTGVESSVPMAMFILILAISAIYAYRKIKEYKNI